MIVTCAKLVATVAGLTAAANVVVNGPCGGGVYISRAPPGTTIDFSAAPLTRLDLIGVSGITVTGVVSTNAPYSALNVRSSSQILISQPRVVNAGTAGITIQGSNVVEVASPWITGSAGNGVDIAGSSSVNIHDGVCEAPGAIAGAKPICVLSWSVTGYPITNIFVQNMVAIGAIQGFELTDNSDLGASGVNFLNNTAAIDRGYCVRAYNVHSLIVQGNTCHPLSATYGTATISTAGNPGAIVTANNVTTFP